MLLCMHSMLRMLRNLRSLLQVCRELALVQVRHMELEQQLLVLGRQQQHMGRLRGRQQGRQHMGLQLLVRQRQREQQRRQPERQRRQRERL